MNKKIESIKKEFTTKQQLLEHARTVLKTEFFGIDNIIDEIINNVSSWFFIPEIQDKPMIINLWGLTGVGKTSLIKRLIQLINFDYRYYRFDLGMKTGSYSFRESLSELCENNDDTPLIIALDEFQHSRTLTPEGFSLKEVKNDENRMVWELLDSGKIEFIDWKRGVWGFDDFLYKLKFVFQAGVEVENGIVVKGKRLFCKELDQELKRGIPLKFVPTSLHGRILEYAGDILNIHLLRDLEKLLLSFSGEDSIDFLDNVLKIAKKPTVRNFSKALIFVLGNLDEAYNMSGNFSADINADDFHKESLKITIPKIKESLKQRFRNEQIARLGNIHIIYPAFSKLTYVSIIRNELTRVSTGLYPTFNVKISFDESIIDLVYSEGVYPSQGARPLFTTINQLIKSNLGYFLNEMLSNDIHPNLLKLSYFKNSLTCNYFLNKHNLHEKSISIITPLSEMRKSKKDDLQAIVAVHESGHVILSSILLKTLPEVVYSVTSDANSHGFTYTAKAWEYTSRKEMINRAAMLLGGSVAEELIFGKENLTSGSSGDIKQVFEYLSILFKENGMGKSPLLYIRPNYPAENSYQKHQIIENEIKDFVLQALELANITLKKERKLLLALSDKLSDVRMLKKVEIKSIIDTYCTLDVEYITNGDQLFYRSHLKKAVAQSMESLMGNYFEPISLNKK